jgi:hypothetical protein
VHLLGRALSVDVRLEPVEQELESDDRVGINVDSQSELESPLSLEREELARLTPRVGRHEKVADASDLGRDIGGVERGIEGGPGEAEAAEDLDIGRSGECRGRE